MKGATSRRWSRQRVWALVSTMAVAALACGGGAASPGGTGEHPRPAISIPQAPDLTHSQRGSLPEDASAPGSAEEARSLPAPERSATPGVPVPPESTPPRGDYDPARSLRGAGTGQFTPLTDPRFVGADEATFLRPEEIVLGLSVEGERRAYPVRQMAFHHIVNDTVRGVPYLVTY